MSLKKVKPIILALITGSVFLPWKTKAKLVYWGIFDTSVEYGYERAAGWVVIAFCLLYLFIEIFIDKEGKTIYETLRKYLNWSLVFVLLFDLLMISFNSGYGFFIPGYGVLLTLFLSLTLLKTNNKK